MMFWFRKAVLGVAFTVVMVPVVAAQPDNLRVSVANLTQDLNQLSREVRTLRLEIESLRRENERLRSRVSAAASDNGMEQRLSELASAVESLRRDYKKADAAQRDAIIEKVTRQIEALGKETERAINAVAEAVEGAPEVGVPVRFSEDYPKTGITYTVQPGDTLSAIAREYQSSIKDIQNANKIANPARDLQVGQTIFIPIPE